MAALTEAEELIRDTPGAQLVLGRTLNRLAAVHNVQRNTSEALRLFAAAMAALEPVTMQGDVERDTAMEGLGRNLYALRDLGGARRTFQQLLEERIAVLGPDDAGVGVTLCLLAKIDTAEGDLATAEERCRRSIGILERALGPNDIEVALALNNLARVVKRRGDYLEALLLTERSLAIFEFALGPEHLNVAGMLNNLGGIRIELGDLEAARHAQERALAIREKTGGPDSAQVAQSLSNLGGIAIHEGEPGRAVPLLDRALAIRERSLGPRGEGGGSNPR